MNTTLGLLFLYKTTPLRYTARHKHNFDDWVTFHVHQMFIVHSSFYKRYQNNRAAESEAILYFSLVTAQVRML